VQLDERCCFGDASAATKCARISNVVVWRVRKAFRAVDALRPMCGMEWLEWKAERLAAGMEDEHAWVGMFVDDLVGAEPVPDDELVSAGGVPRLDAEGLPVRRGRRRLAGVLRRGARGADGARLGSEPSKEHGPCDRLDALGVNGDLIGERLRLTEAKRKRYARHAEEVAAGQRCDMVSFSL